MAWGLPSQRPPTSVRTRHPPSPSHQPKSTGPITQYSLGARCVIAEDGAPGPQAERRGRSRPPFSDGVQQEVRPAGRKPWDGSGLVGGKASSRKFLLPHPQGQESRRGEARAQRRRRRLCARSWLPTGQRKPRPLGGARNPILSAASTGPRLLATQAADVTASLTVSRKGAGWPRAAPTLTTGQGRRHRALSAGGHQKAASGRSCNAEAGCCGRRSQKFR